MSFKQIKELRQAGKLDEALQMANQNLVAEPDNIWNKRAAARVYYEYLKKYAHPDSYESFNENLFKIKELQLPEDDNMFFDNCSWQIGKLIFGLQKKEHVDYDKINELFEIIRAFHFTKPSEAYSLLYKAFHKGYQNWSNYLNFADWWGFDNFRPEDYLKEVYNGNKIMAMAHQAYIAYFKKLLEGKPLDLFGQQREFEKEKIQAFLPKLDVLIEKYPEHQYPPYFKTKLLFALGNNENALSAFLPFAKQKRNDFGVWEMLADIFSDDKDIEFACYCKALSLKTPEDFLVRLRQTFANILIGKGMYNEAKTEIQKVIRTREKHGLKFSNEIAQWIKSEWYESASSQRDNVELYLKFANQAEEILFRDIPEETIVVEFVNENKSMLNFVRDKQKFGIFNHSGHLTKPQIGDIIKVRFNENNKEGFFKILTAKKAEPNTTSDAIKEFEGVIRVTTRQKFGLVEDIFVEPQIIAVNKLTNGGQVKGTAILSFNKKKNEWEWKAIGIK